MERNKYLRRIADAEGYTSVYELLGDLAGDADLLTNGACTNKVRNIHGTLVDCEGLGKVEPDSNSGYCEECRRNTVAHAFILAGII